MPEQPLRGKSSSGIQFLLRVNVIKVKSYEWGLLDAL